MVWPQEVSGFSKSHLAETTTLSHYVLAWIFIFQAGLKYDRSHSAQKRAWWITRSSRVIRTGSGPGRSRSTSPGKRHKSGVDMTNIKMWRGNETSGALWWIGLGTGILVVLLFLIAPSSRYQSRGWLMPICGHVGLSSSFGIPPHSWCAIIEYLCKLNALQVLYHVTSRDKDTSKKQTWRKSLRRNEERAMVITFKVILNVVLLPLQCICCHFHLLQSRWKGMVSVSWLDRPISLKFN